MINNVAQILSSIASASFLYAHKTSASIDLINNYISNNLSDKVFEKELKQKDALLNLVYVHDEPVAYSKIILNKAYPKIKHTNVTKLERLYVIENYISKGIGKHMFNETLKLAKENSQAGLWLYVWIGNKRAIKFYTKQGFKIIDEAMFQISPTHSNPNHIMYLEF